jgi:CheY-like chemotaxis protein
MTGIMVLESEEAGFAFQPPSLESSHGLEFEDIADGPAATLRERDASRLPTTARVLVVDDEEEIRSFLEQALQDEGFVVDTAANGQEALALAAENRPGLVVLDIMLPDLSGGEVADHLRAQYNADLPILVITADTGAEGKAQRAGAFAYLHKPFDLDKLIKLVHQGLYS